MAVLSFIQIRFRLCKAIVKVSVTSVIRRYYNNVIPIVVLKNRVFINCHAIAARLMLV